MFLTQARIADDNAMRQRVTACAAQEGCAEAGIAPDLWTYEWRNVWAASPQWDAAWESALASDNPAPGADPAVITDDQIRAQVQSMMPFVRLGTDGSSSA